jgi:DNA-binding transcriptional LysR family regulator
MKKIDYTTIDGHLLRVFLTVLEESSVTNAAVRLSVTQSTVSHSLAKLRQFFGDPLFIRSGNSLMPTEVANSLKAPVLAVLDDLKGLTHQRTFDPRLEQMSFVVAANDMQRDVIFPQLLRELYAEQISVEFEFIPSGHPTPAMLRDDRCQLVLTPFPPDGSDILQTALLSGKMMCFYDGEIRDAPQTWEEYCRAEHLTVRFPDGGTSLRALTGVDKSKIRSSMVSVPNFSSIPPFLKGTQLIATEMDLMKISTLSSLDVAPLPVDSDTVTVYMVWHKRSTNDPAHILLRQKVQVIAGEVTARKSMAILKGLLPAEVE